MPEVAGIQFLHGGRVSYFLSSGKHLPLDTFCVVETEHGPQLARVVRPNQMLPDNRVSGPLRRVLRPAAPRDLEQYKNNENREREGYRLCRRLATEKQLAMKLVNVNYTLDGRKAIFYFTAENRVDFRELVKALAQALKVKIEMRQIGVRDEARRLGGVGCCGRSLCCCSFLKDFVSVSIRMAKDQNLSLNPTKVSGLCGRLMCCLSYEYEGYMEEKRRQSTGKAAAPREEALEAISDTEAPEERTAPGKFNHAKKMLPFVKSKPAAGPGQNQRPSAPEPEKKKDHPQRFFNNRKSRDQHQNPRA